MIETNETRSLLSPQAEGAREKLIESRKKIESARRKLVQASLLCIFFMIIEVIGGYLAGSLAIISDAAHLLSDVGGFMISLFALMLSDLSATKTLSFGFKRAEVLGALLSVALIWVLTGILLYEAFLRTRTILSHGKTYVDGKIMTVTAIVGLVSNLVMLQILGHNHSHSHGGGGHGHSHGHTDNLGLESTESLLESQTTGSHVSNDGVANGHSTHGHSHNHNHNHSHANGNKASGHGHSHGHDDDSHVKTVQSYGSIRSTESTGVEHEVMSEENINVQAAYAHAIGDLLQSIGVCIAGALIWRFPGDEYPMVQLADPIATLLFSFLVVGSTQQVLKSSVSILMQSVPEGIDPIAICHGLEGIEDVIGIHHLHIWSITQGEPSLSVHVQVASADHMNPALKRVQHYLRKMNFHHSTVQVEVVGDEVCSEDDCEGDKTCGGYALKSDEPGQCHTYYTNETKHHF